MRKFRKIIAIVVFMAMLFCMPVFAATDTGTDETYNYTYWRDSVATPQSYAVSRVITGRDLAVGDLSAPSDMYHDEQEDLLYILDSGNGRIIVLNGENTVERIIDNIVYNGEKLDITGAGGVFIGYGRIVIADTKNNRVLDVDMQGNVDRIMTKPDSASFGEETVFAPAKVVMDSSGNYYVVCNGVYKGAAVYDSSGKFVGFFGSNDVTLTISVLADAIWKKILSEEQTSQMISAVPVEFANLDIDKDGFIYSCTKSDAENRNNTIRKLNYAGNDVLNATAEPVNEKFGELDGDYTVNAFTDTQFVDIHIASDGIISGIDSMRGMVYQYDQEGRLVSVFGGYGEKSGSFTLPTAIEKRNDKILILDSNKGTLTEFSVTAYGEILYEAIALYNSGKYEESYELWQEILKSNSNSEIAYQGIADALYSMGDAKESLTYYKMAYDQQGYSDAFKQVRDDFFRKNFWLLVIVLLFVCALPFVLPRIKFKNKVNSKQILVDRNVWAYPFRMIIHPADTCQDIRYLKKERYYVSAVILLVWYAVTVLKAQLSGFIFNLKPIGDLNIIFIFLSTIGVFMLFTLANWAVSTLTDGEGSYKQIFCICAYALIPAIIGAVASTLLSNILVIEEGIFVNWISVIANGFSIVLMVVGLKHEHRYEGAKSILNFIFSVIGLFLILFLILLLFSLIQQLYVFLGTVVFEMSIRGQV